MAETFAVDTDGLRHTANDMLAPANGTHNVGSTLRTTLDGLGSPWGDDDPGKTFEATYLPPAGDWHTTVIGIANVFKSASDRLLEMARGLEITEESNTAAANGGNPPSGS